jgi:transcription elongation factor S-II
MASLYRTAVRSVIAARCSPLSAAAQEDLERGLFNATLKEAETRNIRRVWENPEFANLYRITAQRVISNLDASSYIQNTRLLKRLQEGEFDPHDIAFMTYSDLYPEAWAHIQEQAVKREAKMLEVDKSAATDMFRCSRCGKRECTYYEMQTRSADEPMTQFIRCLNCGKQWRQ